MPSDMSTAERVKSVLGGFLDRDPATIRGGDRLRDDLGLDSMATIELLYDVEEAFDLQIPDEALKELATVDDVVAYVERTGS